MSVPNHFSVVQEVYTKGLWHKSVDLTTKQGCGEFTEAVVSALHAVDPNWGHFRKRPGQEQWNGHAVDAACYKLGSGVDFIASSQSPTARIHWLPYPDAPPSPDWYFTETPPVVVAPLPTSPVDDPLSNMKELVEVVRRVDRALDRIQEDLQRIEAQQARGFTLTLAPPKS